MLRLVLPAAGYGFRPRVRAGTGSLQRLESNGSSGHRAWDEGSCPGSGPCSATDLHSDLG